MIRIIVCKLLCDNIDDNLLDKSVDNTVDNPVDNTANHPLDIPVHTTWLLFRFSIFFLLRRFCSPALREMFGYHSAGPSVIKICSNFAP
jgi:hypothetical protein